MSADRSNSVSPSYGGYLWFGMATVFLLVVCIGGWAAWASINGAVIAPATVVVETNAKKVQHAEGGIVAELLVREGDHVQAGQLLIRLDETDTRSSLAVIDAQLHELWAAQARLEAERDEAAALKFTAELMTQGTNPEIQKILSGQTKLFVARQKAVLGQKDQLYQRIAQLDDEIAGLEAQKASKQKQISLISQELDGLVDLKKQGLVQINRVLALEREGARLEGELGQLVADVARARGRIGETKLRVIQIDQDAIKEVLTDLRDNQGRIAELIERRIAAKAHLARTEIRSPRSGYVHQLALHTIGGVIQAGEAVMEIIPERDVLVLEALVEPQDIDQVEVAQIAVVRFSAFDQRNTPELNGEVARVSADLVRDGAAGTSYYSVRIKLGPDEIAKLGDKPLKPGMPAEAFIQTGARTAISYLLKPLTDQIVRAFREN